MGASERQAILAVGGGGVFRPSTRTKSASFVESKMELLFPTATSLLFFRYKTLKPVLVTNISIASKQKMYSHVFFKLLVLISKQSMQNLITDHAGLMGF